MGKQLSCFIQKNNCCLLKLLLPNPLPALRDDASLSSPSSAANDGSSSWFSKISSRNPDASSGGYRNINVRSLQASALSLEQLSVLTTFTSTERHHQLVFLPLQYWGVKKNQLFCSLTSLNTPAPEEDQPRAPQAPVCAETIQLGRSVAGKDLGIFTRTKSGPFNLHLPGTKKMQLLISCQI